MLPILPVLFFLASSTAVDVQVHVSTTGSDDYPGNGSFVHPFRTIARALHSQREATRFSVLLAPGVYSSHNDSHLSIKSGAVTISSTNANAGAVVVDLSVSGSPFIVSSTNLTLTNLTIANGWGDSAVISSKSGSTSLIFLSRVLFRNNSASSGGALYLSTDAFIISCCFHRNVAANGGAVLVASSKAMFSGCNFTNNQAATAGGAVNSFGTTTMNGCLFAGNTALSPNYGGGAVFDNNLLLLSHSVFQNNNGTFGGAIFVGNHSSMMHLVFRENHALEGGAVYWDTSPVVARMVSCTFVKNSAVDSGGALGTVTVANVEGSVFEENYAPFGGAVTDGADLSRGMRTLYSGCLFISNSAKNGAAIESRQGNVGIFSCVFRNNSAEQAVVTVSQGAHSSVSDSTFVQNRAATALYLYSTGLVFGSTFLENRGRCLILNGPCTNAAMKRAGVNVANSTFTRNWSPFQEGAVFVQASAEISLCSFFDNAAAGGAAIASDFGLTTLTVLTSLFKGNVGNSGAITLQSPMILGLSRFLDNVAETPYFGGGAVFLNRFFAGGSGASFILQCNFTNNSAYDGGAVNVGHKTFIVDSKFVGNHALNTGGAIFQSQGFSLVELESSVFSHNSASGGGALALNRGATVRLCMFQANTAQDGGAVLMLAWPGASSNLVGCTFTNNSAQQIGGAILAMTTASIDGCGFDGNAANMSGALSLQGGAGATLNGCSFNGNVAAEAHTLFVGQGSRLNLQRAAFCDTTATDSVMCSDHSTVVTGAISAYLPRTAIFSPLCVLEPSTEQRQLMLSSPAIRVFGALCPASSIVLALRTDRNVSGFISGFNVTLYQLDTLTAAPTFAVTDPFPSNTPISKVTAADSFVIQDTAADGTILVSNVEAGNFIAGRSPALGTRIQSAPSRSQSAVGTTRFEVYMTTTGAELSPSQSTAHLLDDRFAWANVRYQFLVQLRDQVSLPFVTDVPVSVRMSGEAVECTGSGSGGHLLLCTFDFPHEGNIPIELVSADGKVLGTLGSRIIVVSLIWVYAGGSAIVLILGSLVLWRVYRAWQRRRQRQADALLANFVGLPVPGRSSTTLMDKSLVISYKELDIRRVIASGAGGEISLALWRGATVAVKKLFTLPSGEMAVSFAKELETHSKLRHPNVVQLLGVSEDPLCMILEFMERGSLFACLQETSLDLPWLLRLRCATDIGCGMAFLHRQSILHRDLKSLNVLVDTTWRCKVADFDQSCTESNTMTATVGTVLWSAPEVLQRQGQYGKAADVYSFGVVLWEIWSREAPFQYPGAPDRFHIRHHIMEGGRPLRPDGEQPPGAFGELIQQCWMADPAQRPTFDAAMEVLTALHQEQSSSDRDPVTPIAAPAVKSALWPKSLRSVLGLSSRERDSMSTPLLPLRVSVGHGESTSRAHHALTPRIAGDTL